jgi:hypothetical protein
MMLFGAKVSAYALVFPFLIYLFDRLGYIVRGCTVKQERSRRFVRKELGRTVQCQIGHKLSESILCTGTTESEQINLPMIVG